MNSEIIMRSAEFKICEIIKPTKAKFFKDLVVGDVIVVAYHLKDPGRGKSLYAGELVVQCINKLATIHISPTNLVTRLTNFKIDRQKGDIKV